MGEREGAGVGRMKKMMASRSKRRLTMTGRRPKANASPRPSHDQQPNRDRNTRHQTISPSHPHPHPHPQPQPQRTSTSTGTGTRRVAGYRAVCDSRLSWGATVSATANNRTVATLRMRRHDAEGVLTVRHTPPSPSAVAGAGGDVVVGGGAVGSDGEAARHMLLRDVHAKRGRTRWAVYAAGVENVVGSLPIATVTMPAERHRRSVQISLRGARYVITPSRRDPSHYSIFLAARTPPHPHPPHPHPSSPPPLRGVTSPSRSPVLDGLDFDFDHGARYGGAAEGQVEMMMDGDNDEDAEQEWKDRLGLGARSTTSSTAAAAGAARRGGGEQRAHDGASRAGAIAADWQFVPLGTVQWSTVSLFKACCTIALDSTAPPVLIPLVLFGSKVHRTARADLFVVLAKGPAVALTASAGATVC